MCIHTVKHHPLYTLVGCSVQYFFDSMFQRGGNKEAKNQMTISTIDINLNKLYCLYIFYRYYIYDQILTVHFTRYINKPFTQFFGESPWESLLKRHLPGPRS